MGGTKNEKSGTEGTSLFSSLRVEFAGSFLVPLVSFHLVRLLGIKKEPLCGLGSEGYLTIFGFCGII